MISAFTQHFGNFLSDKIFASKVHLDSEFAKNVCYAKEAVVYTCNALPYGAYNTIDSKISSLNINAMRLHYVTINSFLSLINASEERKLDVIASVAQLHGVGNCGEQSIVALRFLQKIKNLGTVEALQVINNDHYFIVIGRKKNSSITDVRTWGENAIICDPWGRRYYPASQLEFHLNDILTQRLARRQPHLPIIVESSSPFFNPRTESIGYMGGSYDSLRNRVFTVLDTACQKDSTTAVCNYYMDGLNKASIYTRFISEYLKYHSAAPVEPSLQASDSKSVWDQIEKYRVLQNRSNTHKTLAECANTLSLWMVTGGSMTLLGRATQVIKRPYGLVGCSLMIASHYLKHFSDLFGKHSQMYDERAHCVWIEKTETEQQCNQSAKL